MTKIALLGDIGLFGRHVAANPNAPEFFSDVADRLAGYDLVAGNLETPISTGGSRKGGKSAYLRASPHEVALLKQLNVGAVTLANNHILDFGREGLIETQRVLDEAGIAYFGVGQRPLNMNLGGEEIRLLGYCSYDTNPLGLISGDIDPFSVRALENDLAKAREDGAFPIISLHFGAEHRSYPSPRHQAALKHLAARYDFILHGHHPHMFQPVEAWRKSLLAYSLGNFCFDTVMDEKSQTPFLTMSSLNRMSAIVEVEISGGGLTSWSLVPIRDDGDRLRVEDDQAEAHICQIMSRFAADREECEREASEQRRQFVRSRIERRDLKFFLQRLRPRYARMLLAGMLNRHLDLRCVPFR